MSELSREAKFTAQSGTFIEVALGECGVQALDELDGRSDAEPVALKPTIIDDFRQIGREQRASLSDAYLGEFGVAYWIVRNPDDRPAGSHVLFDIVEQMRSEIPLEHPLAHPLEGHPEALKRFGSRDGTVKIYNLPIEKGREKYREQAETAEPFAMHHDGLGSGGTVETVVLYADSPPLAHAHDYRIVERRLCLPHSMENLLGLSIGAIGKSVSVVVHIERPDLL